MNIDTTNLTESQARRLHWWYRGGNRGGILKGFNNFIPAFPNLDNIIARFDFTNSENYTFSSGNIVDLIAPVIGTINFDNKNSPEYTSAAFGGQGGLLLPATNSAVCYDASFTPSHVHTIGFVVTRGTFVSGAPDYFSFANLSDVGQNGTRLAAVSRDALNWATNQAAGSVEVYNSSMNSTLVVVLRFISDSICKVWINGTETEFDPAAINALVRCRLGSRSTTTTAAGTMFAEFFQTSDAITDEELAQFVAYANAKYINYTKQGFFVIGQSNAVGVGTIGSATRFLHEDRMFVFPNSQVQAPYAVATPIDTQTGSSLSVLNDASAGYSMGPSFMDYYARRAPYNPVFGIAAKGGQSIQSILVSRNASDPDDITTLYGAMLTQYLRMRDVEGLPMGKMVIQGGESDAAASRTETQYSNDLKALIDFFRSDTGENIKFSIGSISSGLLVGSYPTRDQVIDAVLNFVYPNCAIVDASGTGTYPLQGDQLHWTNTGYDALGAAHAANLL